VPQAAKRCVGLAKAQGESWPVAFEDGIDALIGDADVALDVGQSIPQRRRVEDEESEQPIVAKVARRPEVAAPL